MALSNEAIQKLNQLPADKLQLILALVDEFLTTTGDVSADMAGRVLSQAEIDKLVKNIQASMK